MHKTNLIDPVPLIDVASTKIKRTTGATLTNVNAALNVCLDTQNLGSREEIFINGQYNTTIAFAAAERCSFGACLAPINTFADSGQLPLYIEYSIAVVHYEQSTSTRIIPFIGNIDSAAAPISNGWDAVNNLVTNWVPLPVQGPDPSMGVTGQILLKDMVSGTMDTDKYVCLGFIIASYGSTNVDDIDYCITGRYSYSSLNTYREV